MASESITIGGKTYTLFDKSSFETLIPERKESLRFAGNLDGTDVALGVYKGKTDISDYNNLIQNQVDIYGRQSEYEGDDDSDVDTSIEYYKFMADRNGTSPSKIYYIDTEFEVPYYSTTSTNTGSQIVGGRKGRRTNKKSKRRTKMTKKSAKKSKRRRSN
jgi:hypothetical protein